jgi:hypothetical protein
MRRFAAVFIAVLAAMAAGCDETAGPTEPTDVGPFSRTEIFAGRLAPGGTAFYSVVSGNAGSVVVTFASARVINTSTTLSPTLTLGFGVPRGTDCQTSQTVQASPALQSQIRVSIEPGIYCVRIADTGALSQPVDFAIRMILPVESISTPATTPQTETFNSLLVVGGSTARSFVVPMAGSYSITLTGAPTAVGLSVGIPESGSSGCLPTSTVTATANSGTQFSGGIDPGTYCVRVFDVGGITTSINFSINIIHP